MSKQATAPTDWGQVLNEFELGSTPSQFIAGILEKYRTLTAAEDAALYRTAQSGWCRVESLGQRPFPAELSEPGIAGMAAAALGNVLLVHTGPGKVDAEVEQSLLVALSAGVHCVDLERRVKRQSFEVNFRAVELQALYDVGLTIGSTLDLEQLYEEVLLRAVSLIDARRGALYLVSEGQYVLNWSIGGEADSQVELDDPRVVALLSGEAAENGSLMPDVEYLLAAAIETDGRPAGLLLVADKESRTGVGPFGNSDERMLSLFANQAAIALNNAYQHLQALEKERLERELELAAEIQKRLLPHRMPQLDGLEVLGWSRPARHVGGDYFSFLPISDRKLGLALGDVTGKGMPAALLVSTLHSALRLVAERVEVGGSLVEGLNRHLFDTTAANQFVTLLLAEIDAGSGQIRYINAGHNPALLVGDRGVARQFQPGGLPLGMMYGSQYQIQEAALARGELLCVYSDGITEAVSATDVEFGLEGLKELLQKHRQEPLTEIIAAVDRAVVEFTEGGAQGDDQTLILVRRSA